MTLRSERARYLFLYQCISYGTILLPQIGEDILGQYQVGPTNNTV